MVLVKLQLAKSAYYQKPYWKSMPEAYYAPVHLLAGRQTAHKSTELLIAHTWQVDTRLPFSLHRKRFKNFRLAGIVCASHAFLILINPRRILIVVL